MYRYLTTCKTKGWKNNDHEDKIPKRFLHHCMVFPRSSKNKNLNKYLLHYCWLKHNAKPRIHNLKWPIVITPSKPGPVPKKPVWVGDQDGKESSERPDHECGEKIRQPGGEVGEQIRPRSGRVQGHCSKIMNNNKYGGVMKYVGITKYGEI